MRNTIKFSLSNKLVYLNKKCNYFEYLVQDFIKRLLTPKGTYTEDPNYGSILNNVIGLNMDPIILNIYVRKAIEDVENQLQEKYKNNLILGLNFDKIVIEDINTDNSSIDIKLILITDTDAINTHINI